jgi:hypothetical protein
VEAALDAAGRGDLDSVRRILSEAKERIDTIGALLDDDSVGDGIEEP